MSKHPHSERRQFGRRESCLHAVAIVAGRGHVHCKVANMSQQGALIVFDEKIVLPPVIRLKIEALGVEYPCCVRHSTPKGAGVMFVEEAEAREIIAQTESKQVLRQLRALRSAPAQSNGAALGAQVRERQTAETSRQEVRPLEIAPGGVIRGV